MGGGRGNAASSDGDDRSGRSRWHRASPGPLGGVAADGEEKKNHAYKLYRSPKRGMFSPLFAAGSVKKNKNI